MLLLLYNCKKRIKRKLCYYFKAIKNALKQSFSQNIVLKINVIGLFCLKYILKFQLSHSYQYFSSKPVVPHSEAGSGAPQLDISPFPDSPPIPPPRSRHTSASQDSEHGSRHSSIERRSLKGNSQGNIFFLGCK